MAERNPYLIEGPARQADGEGQAMTALAPCFQDELMLAGWSETHSGGAKLVFWLPDSAALDVFRAMTVKKGNQAGQRFACVLVELGDDDKPVPKTQISVLEQKQEVKGEFGHYYRTLYGAGGASWFNSHEVKRALCVTPDCSEKEMKAELYRIFDVTSLSQVDPQRFANWAAGEGIYHTLPLALKVLS